MRSGPAGEQLDRVGESQRRELEHDLAVDVEWHLTGAQDPQPWCRIEEAHRQSSGGIDDVLAVVEDHHGGGGPEALQQRLFPAGTADGADQHVDHVVGRGCGLEPGQPDAVGRRGQPAADGDRDRRLPDPAWPHDLHEPLAGQQVGDLRDLLHTTDERTGHRRQVPGRRRGIDPCRHTGSEVERRVLDQDPLFELLQLRPGIEPELLGQLVLDPLVRREGIRLTAGSVQRRDQQLPQALLERVRRNGCFELADHV